MIALRKHTIQSVMKYRKEIMKKLIDLEADAQAPAPSNEAILQITSMCGYVKHQDIIIADLTSRLAQAVAHRTKLIEVDIPEAMKIAGLISFTLEDGTIVILSNENHASYTKINEPAVFAWLRKNGHAAIIKSVIAVQFGMGQDAKAEALVKLLTTKKYEDWTHKESIHAGTFKAFVREQLSEGNTLPKQIAIFEKSVATLKEPKNGNPKKAAISKASSSKERF
jgi:hypothetical protein